MLPDDPLPQVDRPHQLPDPRQAYEPHRSRDPGYGVYSAVRVPLTMSSRARPSSVTFVTGPPKSGAALTIQRLKQINDG
jgi:hypothetical protein